MSAAGLVALAQAYFTRVLGPEVPRDRAAWSWRPDTGQMRQMSIDQLWAMKKRANAQMKGNRR